MRTWLLALPFLLAGAAAAEAAVVEQPLEVKITEVFDTSYDVEVHDVFAGTIKFDPADLENMMLTPVERLTFEFDGTTIEIEDAQILDVGGDLILTFNVEEVMVFGATAALGFIGTGGDITFFDEEGPVVTGEFSVVPVPAALPLLATGLAGLAWLRRRQRG